MNSRQYIYSYIYSYMYSGQHCMIVDVCHYGWNSYILSYSMSVADSLSQEKRRSTSCACGSSPSMTFRVHSQKAVLWSPAGANPRISLLLLVKVVYPWEAFNCFRMSFSLLVCVCMKSGWLRKIDFQSFNLSGKIRINTSLIVLVCCILCPELCVPILCSVRCECVGVSLPSIEMTSREV